MTARARPVAPHVARKGKGDALMAPRSPIRRILTLGLLGLVGCSKAPAPPAAGPAPPPRSAATKPAPPGPQVAQQPAPPPAPPKVAEAPKRPTLRINLPKATLEPGDPGLQLTVEADGTHGGSLDRTAQVAW